MAFLMQMEGPTAIPEIALDYRHVEAIGVMLTIVPEEIEEEENAKPLVELRNYFPETWLWKLSRTGWVVLT